MDGTLMLVLLSITMFVGSFVSGLIPLTLTLSENKMRLITIIGAGLLVGTALAVIIPEGVHTLYKNGNLQNDHSHAHKRSIDPIHELDHLNSRIKRHDGHNENHNKNELLDKIKNENSQHKDNKDNKLDSDGHENTHDSSSGGDEKAHSGSHSSIGVTLVLGFVFMLIVDQIGGHVSHVPNMSLDSQAARNKITFTTTLGLVIHAGVDGLALGAAAASTQTDIEMIVFIAIMLHKAPASFGLVSFLLHEGLDRVRARRHLLIFALAAPIMAIITYFVLNMPNQQNIVSSNSTGLCMLFSAGTFLYVSTIHVLPEVQRHNEDKSFRLSELGCLILGAILPLFLSVGHSH